MHSMAHMLPMIREREMEKEEGREGERECVGEWQAGKEGKVRLNNIDENEGKEGWNVHHKTRIKWTVAWNEQRRQK